MVGSHLEIYLIDSRFFVLKKKTRLDNEDLRYPGRRTVCGPGDDTGIWFAGDLESCQDNAPSAQPLSPSPLNIRLKSINAFIILQIRLTCS